MKLIFLKILYGIARLHVFYYILLLKLGFPFRDVSIDLSFYTGRYGIILRRIYYKKTLKSCGELLVVHYGSYFCYRDVSIGRRVSIEEQCVISLCDIGDDTILAHRTSVMSGGNHHEIDDLNTPFIESNLPLKRVSIGKNCWVGVHSVIMNDVSPGTVVAANAVVTKVFEENVIIAGVPARLIRRRGPA